MAIDVERLDVNPFGWSSIIYSVNGQEMFGITGISCGWKRERVDGYGLGRSHAPRTYSKGKVSFEPVKLKLHKDTVESLRSYYARFASDQRSFADVRLNHVIQYVEKGSFNTQRIDLVNTAWTGETINHEENPDPLMTEIELKALRVWLNGCTPWDNRNARGPAVVRR